MRIKLIFILINFISFGKFVLSEPDLSEYNLIFSEEFDSIEQLHKNWDYDIGNGINGWGDLELEYYKSTPQNIFLENNQLHIIARNTSFQNFKYTSARITTKNTFNFQYGYVKAEIKMPRGDGIWPAFWMLGKNYDKVKWPECGAINFVEARDYNDMVGSNYYWLDEETEDEARYGLFKDVSNREAFHVYELMWDENYIQTLVDGKEIVKMDISKEKFYAFKQGFYFILNVAVGGKFPTKKVDEDHFPSEMIVKYIKVYQKKNPDKGQSYQHTPKTLLYEIKKTSIRPNVEHYYLPCFKYGEIRLNVSFPLIKGMTSKIYLFSKAGSFTKNNILYRNSQTTTGQIALLTTYDDTNIIISGVEWKGEKDYTNKTEDFYELDIWKYNIYVVQWDESFINIFGNDVLIYSIDIRMLPEFQDYYYLSIYFDNHLHLATEQNLLKLGKSYIYQYKNNTQNLPNYNYGHKMKMNIWIIILLLIILL